MIRILIVSSSPVLPSGMAEATRLIFGGLLDRFPGEYELYQVALYHSFVKIAPRWPLFPTRGVPRPDGTMHSLEISDISGEETCPRLIEELKPDIVFAFNDPQHVLHLCEEPRAFRLILYINFDGMPYPPGAGHILNKADCIVTMSRFSRDVLLRSVPVIPPEKVSYIYSPADTSRFHPVAETAKLALRRRIFPEWMNPNSFIFGWVGRNQWRKQVWVAYSFISHLRKGGYFVCEHCSRISTSRAKTSPTRTPRCRHCLSNCGTIAPPLPNVHLWLHMHVEESQAWDPRSLENAFGLQNGQDIHYTDNLRIGNWSDSTAMASLYQAWDCLLYLSGGEGFGVPAWEAISSGLPVLYTDYSSHAEFLRLAKAGLPIGGVLQPEPTTCILRMIANLEEAIQSARNLISSSSLKETLGANGHRWVRDNSSQIEEWHSLFHSSLTSRHLTPAN